MLVLGGHRLATGRAWGTADERRLALKLDSRCLPEWAMTTESLTYSELGDRLGSSPEAARSLARRLRLLRKPDNDGKVRVVVDLAEIHYKPVPARSPDGPKADNAALNARIEHLQAELARLEVESGWKVKCRPAEAGGGGDSSSLHVARTHSGQPRRQ